MLATVDGTETITPDPLEWETSSSSILIHDWHRDQAARLKREQENVHVTKSGVVIPRWLMYSGVAGIIGYLIRKKSTDALLAGTAGAIIAFAREGKLFPKRKQLTPYMPSNKTPFMPQPYLDMSGIVPRKLTVDERVAIQKRIKNEQSMTGSYSMRSPGQLISILNGMLKTNSTAFGSWAWPNILPVVPV